MLESSRDLRRKEQEKAAEPATQDCLGTVLELRVGFSLGVRRGRGKVFAVVFPLLDKVLLQISHRSCFQEYGGEASSYGQDRKHQFWHFSGVLSALAREGAGWSA